MHELFTIGFPQVTSNSAVLALRWEKLSVPVNLAVDTNAQFLVAFIFVAVIMAIGGSTNAIIHLTAIAGRVGVPISLERLNRISDETPVLVDLKPSGDFYMEDFFNAGGLGAVLAELRDQLHLGCMTVTGETLAEVPDASIDDVDRAVEAAREALALLTPHQRHVSLESISRLYRSPMTDGDPSGFVKLASGDPTWRNLTALTYHYWTQPLPPWTAWYAHHLPAGFQQLLWRVRSHEQINSHPGVVTSLAQQFNHVHKRRTMG